MTEDTRPDAGPDHPSSPPPSAGCPIVGIGASAGGVDALRRLLANVGAGVGMAFVVVQHLDPGRPSALAEILGRTTVLPVTVIADGTAVEAEHVYVTPPNAVPLLDGGRLYLTAAAAPRAQPKTIDEFFISLARDRGDKAACVILSGTGSDGTLGLRAVKEAGGLTIAQSEAEYDGMMRSAVATGLVDFVLPPEEMVAQLAAYFDHAANAAGAVSTTPQQNVEARLDQITTLLRAQTGHDFSNYKDRTIVRRVRRRMHVLHMDDVDSFIERLRHDSREVELLFQDLLIGVTSFFRDPEAFAALQREVIPLLFRDKHADDTVRVWVPGCATGEEAYSIGILLREALPKFDAPKLQIFASDIDEHALNIARVGRYPATIAKDLSPERLERWFQREDGTYRIAAELREICLFSSHNLLRDAPFSKLDLISCRNLLIYLSSELQDRIIPLFHYALLPEAFLFLGTSENVTRHGRLFHTVDKLHRLFRRRPFAERRIPEFPLTAPDTARRPLPLPTQVLTGEPSLRAVAERQLLERFAPAYAVINIEGDLLQSSGRTGRYLELPPGAPDTNIFSMARPGLRMELRAALHKAMSTGQTVVQPRVVIGINGSRQELDVHVHPLRLGSTTEGLFMVVFQDVGSPAKGNGEATGSSAAEIGEDSTHHLETELQATKERLQATTEELEASNEELKSGNEELQSMNEELQSANEELETSKEELQSVNEELQTVNAELNARVEELSRANNDMRNLLESTQIATVFLDRMLNVKSFTPAAKDVFRLVESDAGRPIMHVRPRFDCDTLQDDAERVLRTLATIERPVASNENDTRYIMRMLPYRTADNVINGIVLTFTDITRISAAEARIQRLTQDLRARVSELETLLELVPVGVMIADNGETQRTLVNSYGQRLLGSEEGQKGLVPVTMAFKLFEDGHELRPEREPLQRAARAGETVPGWQGRMETAGGRSTHVMISATPLLTEFGQVRGAIAAIVDMSEHKRAEERQTLLLHERQHRVKNILATISSLATRMLQRAASLHEFREPFLSRIGAMARMHDLLAGGSLDGAPLRRLIETALHPYATLGANNVLLSGPDVRLLANSAATMGMVLHELVTNAAKYGALSSPTGSVQITWRRLQDEHNGASLQLNWHEHDGPAVKPPDGAGFGTRFIARSVEYELRGTVEQDYASDGLKCTVTFPLEGNVDD